MGDEKGRKAIDVATPKHKQAILRRSLLFRRYEVRDGHSEYVSNTCVVCLAKDHMDVDKNVVLKFIRNRDHFDREIIVRRNGLFEAISVISTFII